MHLFYIVDLRVAVTIVQAYSVAVAIEERIPFALLSNYSLSYVTLFRFLSSVQFFFCVFNRHLEFLEIFL